MESLDASYALLSDVSARNRELQARLRNKMPFLWTDTELLRIKGPPRRHRAKKLPGEQAASSEADQMLLALEGQAVTRQYKRRVEWEVARRIARVDREMQQYQPAQRFWNQKREKTVVPTTSASAKRRLHENLSDAVRGDVVKRQDEESGGREKRKEVKVTVIECKSDVTAETKRKKKWVRPDIEKKTDERLAENRVVVRQVSDRELDKENAQPNTAIKRKEQLLLSVSPSIASATINQRDDLPLVENQNKTKPDIEPASSSKTEVENNTSLPAQVKSARWQDEPNSTSEENVEKENEEALYVQRKRDADQKSPGRIHTLKKDRASSSIGKQVLSEYRTMPSVPSFGTRPILSTGKSTQFRLNPDVLRRLFSDFDTDKDGLLNRIETCLALHRLQISVPTAKIITFFRHIHSSDRKGTTSCCGKHVPTKEAINYKQFVAFVTTAYDQQQQHKKTRRHSVTSFKKWQNDRGRSPLPVPLTTLPTFASPTSSTAKTFRPSALIRKDEIPVYEMDDVGLEKNEVFEERMINEITDFVVGTILADTPGAASEENRDVAESIVRKSLESLVGEDAVNSKLVDEITCELIKERLRRISAPNQEDTDDITGLRKALAHYNEQILEGDKATSLVAEQSNSEISINAVDILEEEQVGCGCIGQGPDVQSVRLVDEATDTNELLSAPVEKAIQVPETVNQKYDDENANAKVVPPQVPESMSSQTHLVQTLRVSLTAREYTMGLDELLTLVSAIKILEQRQLHQRDALEDQPDFPISEAKKLSPIPPRIDLVNKEDMLSLDEANESVSSKTVPLDSVPASKTEAAITCTHTFMRANSYESSVEYENSVSMSSSSSFSESSDDYYVHSMHQKVGRHPFYDRLTRHRRPQRSQGSVFKSVSDNSGLDSICSAELSEGELSCEDLSDGEIFDACKRRYAKSKLANPNMMKRSRESEGLISSVESGELPGLTKVHATHESQVLGRSAFSSIESGEVEDGRIIN